MITFLTYNLKDYHRHHTPDELARYQLAEAVIRHTQPDVVAVQELPGHSRQRAEAALLQLADATAMACRLGPDYTGPVAVTPGSHDDLAIGLIWRPPIWAVPDSLSIHAGSQWWHALISVVLHLAEGCLIEHCCYHAPPRAGGTQRPDEARLIVEAMATGRPAMIGANWNNPYYFQDRNATTLGWPQPGWDERDEPALSRANKATARVLTSGGLYDTAVVLGHARPVTTGHWLTERNGERPIDAILATADIVDAIRECFVVGTDLSRRASDHLPTGVRYDPTAR